MKIESGFSAMSTKGQTPIVFITQGFFWGCLCRFNFELL